MSITFYGKRILVTGASSGIGETTARHFAALGGDVALVSEKHVETHRVAESICAAGGRATAFVADFTQQEQVIRLIGAVEDTLGPLDVVVNNAGLGLGASVVETRAEDLRLLFDVNFFALAELSKQALRVMAPRGRGHIINVSSGSARLGLPGVSAYCASKAAVHGYTQALRAEARQVGVTVSEVLPISIRTPFFDNVRGQQYRPRGITQAPEAVARAIVRAASQRCPTAEILPYRPLYMAFVFEVLWPGVVAGMCARNYGRTVQQRRSSDRT